MDIGNNERMRRELHRIIREELDRVLEKGFFGTIAFGVIIEDGAIQRIERDENRKYKTTK
jgi:hypothetical protein